MAEEVTPSKDVEPTIDGIPNVKVSKDPKNRTTMRMPDGSWFNWDFEEGNEHAIFQHKSGSMVQFSTDGSVKIVSAKGKMGIEINGEGYMRITGAFNIVCDGSAGFRIEKDAEFFVGGDCRFRVSGTLTHMAENYNVVVAEKIDMGAKSMTLKSVDGTILASTGDVDIASQDADVNVDAGVNITETATGTHTSKGARIDHNN